MNRTRVSAMLLVAALLLPLVWATAGGAAAQTQPDGGLVESQPVGWNEGRFSVSDDGAAQYTLPLWMPLGRSTTSSGPADAVTLVYANDDKEV